VRVPRGKASFGSSRKGLYQKNELKEQKKRLKREGSGEEGRGPSKKTERRKDGGTKKKSKKKVKEKKQRKKNPQDRTLGIAEGLREAPLESRRNKRGVSYKSLRTVKRKRGRSGS